MYRQKLDCDVIELYGNRCHVSFYLEENKTGASIYKAAGSCSQGSQHIFFQQPKITTTAGYYSFLTGW